MSFNAEVWNLCKRVPKGKLTTYKALAEQLNCKAYRAIGNALNKNPYAPKVPCHRVIKTNGELGGFAHGSQKKKELLQKEGIKIREGKIENFQERLFTF